MTQPAPGRGPNQVKRGHWGPGLLPLASSTWVIEREGGIERKRGVGVEKRRGREGEEEREVD